MSEVERLRNEVKRRRQAVGNKIARTRRVSGANVAGSEFDPRRDPEVIKRYNTPQLRRYLADLNGFMARKNQFAAGDGGAPLPRNEVRVYEAKVDRFRNAGQRHMDTIGKQFIRPIGVTVEQFYGDRTKNRRLATVNTPYGSAVKSVKGITSHKALKELEKKIDEMNSENFLGEKLAQGRRNVRKALDIMGRQEDIATIDTLSDYQFDVLWFGSPFAEIVFSNYDIIQERAAGTRKERWQDKVISDNAVLIPEFLEWASNDIPREGK